jgi:hypothetical protein
MSEDVDVNVSTAVSAAVRTAHSNAAKLDVREIARRLNQQLGATLVAGLTGSKDRKISYKWAQHDGPAPKEPAVRRLQFAYAQWSLIAEVEGEHVARMWFIGSNPWLESDTPIDGIREGNFKEVAAAAQAFVDDTFSG